jgi:hypothetical protein
MRNNYYNYRPALVATIGAGLLVFALGLTQRILEVHLLTPTSSTPINSDSLKRYPMQIGDWTGKDVPINEAEIILDKISADVMINRFYSYKNGRDSVSLFIAASGITDGIMVGHPPEICNVMSGYQLVDQRQVELILENNTKLPCTILQFYRGDSLIKERKTILCYYMADKQFCGNRSVLQSRVQHSPSIVNCIAQIQIFASSVEDQTSDGIMKLVSDFAVDSASSIVDLLSSIQKDQTVNSAQTAKEVSHH